MVFFLQEAYLEELFKPGRFSLTAIHKAYQTLRDTAKPNIALRVPLSVSRLRRDIPALIQDLVRKHHHGVVFR